MTISVTQLNNYIHGVFDMDGVLSNVSVCGEVTNVKKARDGWYFSVKDEQAAINCFCYDNTVPPEAGAMVVVDGQVNYFTRSGSVSLFVRRLTATKNTGAAYLKFVELKEKLKSEGLFDEDRKRVVPHCCNKVGIVTSETGAVIHDITKVSLRRQPFVNLILYPVKVQGVGAEQEIAQGIAYFADTDVDVVIVGRGGGSNEDLSVFNSETIVRAVASSPKPIVSAVGHGVDMTLCDFAADRCAVTPSEAAEFVTIDVASAKRIVCSSLIRASAAVSQKLSECSNRVDYLLKNINYDVNFALEKAKNQVLELVKCGESNLTRQTDLAEQKINASIAKINLLNPLNVLQRGYAYVSNAKGIVKSVDDVEVSDEVALRLNDGGIVAQVLAKEKK